MRRSREHQREADIAADRAEFPLHTGRVPLPGRHGDGGVASGTGRNCPRRAGSGTGRVDMAKCENELAGQCETRQPDTHTRVRSEPAQGLHAGHRILKRTGMTNVSSPSVS